MSNEKKSYNEPHQSSSDREEVASRGSRMRNRKQRQCFNSQLLPKTSEDTKSELRNVYNGLIACGPTGKRRRVPAILVMARVQRDRALKGDTRAAEFIFKQAEEFGFLDEPVRFSLRKIFTPLGFSLLSDSAREEARIIEQEMRAEEEKAAKKMT